MVQCSRTYECHIGLAHSCLLAGGAQDRERSLDICLRAATTGARVNEEWIDVSMWSV